MSGRMTVEEWHAKLQLEDINHDDTKYILWDWQNDRVELLKRIEELELMDLNNYILNCVEINKKVVK